MVTEIPAALPFLTSRQPASVRVSRQPYSISGNFSPPLRHRRPRPPPPPPSCRHRRWITSSKSFGYCRWPWLQADSPLGDSFPPLPPFQLSPFKCSKSQTRRRKRNKIEMNLKGVVFGSVIINLSFPCPPPPMRLWCVYFCCLFVFLLIFKTRN